jgi:Carboxypeptidase regulatory-like domain
VKASVAALCFLTPVAIWPQQLPLTPDTDLLKIEGRVVNIISGEPVHKATVTLTDVLQQGSRRAATSDATGRFLFENIKWGTYRLSGERTGFLHQEYGGRASASLGAPVSISAGQSITGLILKLTPQGAITGKVLDEESEAAPGASVVVLRQTGFGNSRRLTKIDWAVTNDLGEFRIPGLSPGRYFLAADGRDASGHAGEDLSGSSESGEDYVPSFYPGTADPAAAAAIQVEAGQTNSGINIPLRRTRVYHLRGKVLAGPASGTLQSIQVTMLPRRQEEVMMGLAQMTCMATAEGAFEFRGVPPGSYYLVAIRTEGQAQILGRMPIEVAGGNLEDLAFSIGEGLELAGSVRVEGEQTVVLRGVILSLLPSDGLPMVPPSTAVSENGVFRIAGVSRDSYRLNLAGLPEGTYVKSVRLSGQEALDKLLDLRQARSAPALEITLGAKAGSVEGSVRGDSKTLPASVILVPEPIRPNQPFLYKQASTGSDGRFKMTGLAPGDYKLYAFEEEADLTYYIDPEWAKPLETAGDKVTIGENGRESVELRLIKLEETNQ